MKPKLLILIGAPGSGKSTWSKQFVKENPDYFRVNRDDMRLMLQGKQMLSFDDERILTKIAEMMVWNFTVYNNKSVVLDQTNCKEKYITALKNKFHMIPIEYKVFDEPLGVLLERNKNRTTDKVPEEIITNMYNNLQRFKHKYM